MMDFIQVKQDSRLELNIDNHKYNESELLEIKVPINMPYQNEWSDYERCYGEIEYHGSYYTYVSRKVANDTLYLKCIDNTSKSHLQKVKGDYFKNTNDLAQGAKKSGNTKTPVFKKIPDFVQQTHTISLASQAGNSCFGKSINEVHFPDPVLNVIGQPPQAI